MLIGNYGKTIAAIRICIKNAYLRYPLPKRIMINYIGLSHTFIFSE
jgi:predicted RNA-binding protein YlqC (UPF0109 family)